MPWSVKKNQTSLSLGDYKLRVSVNVPNQTAHTTFMLTKKSLVSTILDRHYLKFVDVLSYVGGIFPTLFSLFFFMKWFSAYFLGMTFAYLHFKCK
jgi:hypothetical protein